MGCTDASPLLVDVCICKYLNIIKRTICHSIVKINRMLSVMKEFCFIFTCKNVLPSSRNKRNGTSKSIAFRNSVHPLAARYCAPDTAHIGALIPAIQNQNTLHFNSIDFVSIPNSDRF